VPRKLIGQRQTRSGGTSSPRSTWLIDLDAGTLGSTVDSTES